MRLSAGRWPEERNKEVGQSLDGDRIEFVIQALDPINPGLLVFPVGEYQRHRNLKFPKLFHLLVLTQPYTKYVIATE